MSNRWAILIGIDQYHESLGSLKYAGADCQAMQEALVCGPLAFPEDQILRLDDTQDAEHHPTFANIHSCLGSWLAAPKEDDLVLVYFAGHGRLEDGNTYLVPSDATLATIHTLGIALRHVQSLIERCKAKQKLLILDACHSGAGRDVTTMASGMQDALAQGTGFYTISSCGAEELSHEWKDKGHGVFSFFLAEALRGGCSPAADGRLTMDRLYEWVHDRTVKWAAQRRCSQTPQRFAKGGGSLVLAESAPDHAALAQQYRRELEETQARLAEIELRQARDRVAMKEAQRLEEAKAKKLRSRPSRRSALWLPVAKAAAAVLASVAMPVAYGRHGTEGFLVAAGVAAAVFWVLTQKVVFPWFVRVFFDEEEEPEAIVLGRLVILECGYLGAIFGANCAIGWFLGAV